MNINKTYTHDQMSRAINITLEEAARICEPDTRPTKKNMPNRDTPGYAAWLVNRMAQMDADEIRSLSSEAIIQKIEDELEEF